MTKIVVALDGSEHSRAALDAAKAAASPGTRFILLTVLPAPHGVAQSAVTDPPWRWPGQRESFTAASRLVETPVQATERLRDETLALLEPVASATRNAGFDATAEVAFGDPAEEILRAAEHEKANAVAVATHGMTGIRGVLMGSVASALVKARRLPVLVAPAS
jgi:nucleotide-binding universal stress UspA family protein